MGCIAKGDSMGAKVLLRNSVKVAHMAQTDRCYMIAETGEEISVTKEMVKLACKQLLKRCKKI